MRLGLMFTTYIPRTGATASLWGQAMARHPDKA